MKGKLTLLAGIGAGYVLGTRAGRERYDQIAGQAKKVWRDPRVREKAEHAREVATEKAEQARQVATEKAAHAGEAVKEKVDEKRGSGAEGTDPTTPGPHVTR